MDFKQYDKLINDKLRKYTLDFAKKTELTNIIPKGIGLDEFRGGGGPRDHPMIGTDSRTYAPSTNAPNHIVGISNPIGGKKKKSSGITDQDVYDFGHGFRDGFVGTAQMFGDAAQAISPLAMLAAGKPNELEKAKSSLKAFLDGERKTKPSKKHLQLLENNNIISKLVGNAQTAGSLCKKVEEKVEGGKKVNRLKKAEQWTDFSANTINTGLDLGAKAKMIAGKGVNRMKKAQKWTDFSANTLDTGLNLAAKAKMIAGAKKGPSKWIQFVKLYAAKNGITYKEALSRAGPEYKKLSGGNFNPAF